MQVWGIADTHAIETFDEATMLYATFPANLLIYGINDVFDYETDTLNAKKEEYETLLHPREHFRIFWWSVVLHALFIPWFVIFSKPALFALVLFLMVTYLANILGPPPPDYRTVAWSAILLWLIVPWGYWIDRNRHLRHGPGSRTGKLKFRGKLL